ncbi:type VII secretion protein EccB [Tessaracoccus sp. ZS01]|uniref:type VII secretion protein EccB n=1 Tax=Tessaracoccus sp. ZS01 TaxID=1906324 RepID=UPI00096FD381|nr:type VII secretion protein EccB [Tessaracoccus sp. ZS01]MCG6568021.1 type VII secretion protein EccB [Tessaracoccus sp. ZS01]OMG54282.1 type VII secretion protein EccB [Tessaracoccus sp. ZS01]
MATRKDLLKAHAFTSRRMIAAFVDRDPDDPTPPLRRVSTATFVSVLLGVVLLAGTALIGLLRGGVTNESWRDQDNVILNDVQSGQLFAHTNKLVIPVTDVATARLLAAGDDPGGPPRIIDVKTEALVGTEMQQRQGIPGAPPQLPAAKDLASFPLRLCSTEPMGRGRYLTLQFGATEPSSMDYSFIAKASEGTRYLVSGGQSHELYSARGSGGVVSFDVPEVEPGNSWIYALPMGAPINPPQITGYGDTPVKAYQGKTIGDVVAVTGSNPVRYFVQLNDGLAQISYLEAKLLFHEKNRDFTQEVGAISERDLSGYLIEDLESITEGGIPMYQPKAPPGYESGRDASVCATFSAETPDRVSVSMGQTTPALDQRQLGAPTGKYIDHIDLPPLKGALLRNGEAGTDEAAATLLLNGRGYGIPTMGARQALGYGEATPLPVTGGLLNLIRSGLPSGVALGRDHVEPAG